MDEGNEEDSVTITRYVRRRLDRARDDAGFTMMEATVAAVILGVVVTLAATLLVQVAGLTRSNGQRSAAANLASTQMERVRQLSATAIPDGRTTTTQTVGNTTYTINQDSTYQDMSGASNACGGSGALAYKRVAVTVTWPNMGSVKPVRSETLRALGFDAASGGLDKTKGALAVQVLDQNGSPVSGADVTVRRGSATGAAQPVQTTGGDGCVVFTGLTAGSYYSSTTMAGFVASDGGTVAADTGNGVSANAVAKRSLSLAPASAMTVAYSVPTGASVPAMPISLKHPLWSTAQVFTSTGPCPMGTGKTCWTTGNTFTPLYPGAYLVTIPGSTATDSVAVQPGTTTTDTFALGAVTITAATSGTYTTTIGGANVTLGTFAAGQVSTIALPPGTWTLKRSSGATATVTITAATTTAVTL